jgi:hypothetical protein
VTAASGLFGSVDGLADSKRALVGDARRFWFPEFALHEADVSERDRASHTSLAERAIQRRLDAHATDVAGTG